MADILSEYSEPISEAEEERRAACRSIIRQIRPHLRERKAASYVDRMIRRMEAEDAQESREAFCAPRCSIDGCPNEAAPADVLCWDCREQTTFLLDWDAEQAKRRQVRQEGRRRFWLVVRRKARRPLVMLSCCCSAMMLTCYVFGPRSLFVAFGFAATVCYSAGVTGWIPCREVRRETKERGTDGV